MVRIFTVCAAALLISCQSAPKRPQSVRPFSRSALAASEQAILGAAGFTDAAAMGPIGYALYDPASRRLLAAKNADQAFMPASVHKIMTSVAALEILGADYRFQTRLAYTGKITHGVLRGDLYLVGGGDPFLTVPNLVNLAQQLKARGIQRIEGKFFYDDSRYVSRPAIDILQDEDADYNPGVSALSLNFNLVRANWAPTNDPETLEAYVLPPLERDAISLARNPIPFGQRFAYADGERWTLSSEAPPAGKQKLPVKKPALYAASFFRKFAEKSGLGLPAPEPASTPSGAKTLLVHGSRPLIELVDSLLEYSNNLIAELLLLECGRHLTGRAARKNVSTADASSLLSAWWSSRIPDLDWSTAVFENGSGLSEKARMTPRQLVRVLEFASSREHGGTRFSTLLPISGWKGTLTERMTEPDVALSVFAKTGTMNYASGLAGYLFTRNNRNLIFSIFVSEPERRKEVAQAKTIEDYRRADGAAEDWLKRAKKVQDALLTHWALTQ